MDKAKAAVHKIIGHSHHEDTDVDERVARPVTHEVIAPVKEVVEQAAVVKDIHQHHIHTTIQPVEAEEVQERHTHRVAPVQRQEIELGSPAEVEARLAREMAKFKDTSVMETTKEYHVAAPEVTGEHHHHHVHELIQPIIDKKVIDKEIIHETIPINQIIHTEPKVHGTSILPVKSMAEFQGHLDGSEGVVNRDHYDDAPRPYNPKMQLERTEADINPHVHVPDVGHHHGSGTTGPHHSTLLNKADPHVDSDRDGRGVGAGLTSPHSPNTTAGPHSSDVLNKADPRVDSDRDGRGIGGGLTSPRSHATTGMGTHTSPTTTVPHHTDTGNRLDPRVDSDRSSDHSGVHKKPGLLDRLNPLKDTDHDGKKGFME